MGRTRVADVMTTQVVSVGEDTGYRDMVDLLVEHGISALAVTDRSGRVVGVVSEADLLAKVEFAAPFPAASKLLWRRRRRSARGKALGDVAGDIMTTPAVTIQPGLSLAAAARRMADEDVKQLPVVDAHGMLVGLVARRDLLHGYLRTDEQIREAVRSDVLWEWFRLGPREVTVGVRDGIVTLAGEMERHRQAALAVHLTRGVDGVVDVIDRLTYRVEDVAPGQDRPGLAAE